MCGRYTLTDPEAVAEAMLRDFGVEMPAEPPRYNIAPSQDVPVVRTDGTGRREASSMRWGLVPAWDRSERPKFAPINARAEEAFGKTLFREAIQRRRALFPCDGFYEWKAGDSGPKTPYYFRLRAARPFVIAGIYEEANAVRGRTAALFTTGPNELMAPIHGRMPVILDAESAVRWLRPGPISAAEMAAFCRPYPASDMAAHPVSQLVNGVRNDVPECIAPS